MKINTTLVFTDSYADTNKEPSVPIETTHLEQTVIEMTGQSIEEMSKLSLPLEVLPNLEEVKQVVSELDQEISNIVKTLDKKLDDLFSVSNPTTPPKEQFQNALKLIESEYVILQEKLNLLDERDEFVESINTKLQIPLNAMIIGSHLAEKISEHLGTVATVTAFAGEIGLEGLGVIGIGMKCYKIQAEAKTISNYQTQLDSLHKLITTTNNPKQLKEAHQQIILIEKKMNALQTSLQDQIVEVTQEFFQQVFEKSENFIDFVSSSPTMLTSHAEVLSKMMTISSGLSIAGAIVSLGWTSYQVYQHSNALDTIGSAIEQLLETHQSMTSDQVTLAYITQAKIDRLKELKKDKKVQLGLKIVNLSASSLALTAAFKGALLASGIVLGTTASAALTGTGVAGITLLGGTALLGGGITAYKNRYNIEYAVKALPLVTEKIIINNQLKKVNNTYQQGLIKLKQLSAAFEENKQKQAQLLTIPDNIEDLLKLNQSQARFKQVFETENKILLEINDANETLVKTKNLSKQLFDKLSSLNNQQAEIRLNRKVKNLEKGFKTYDLTTLNIVKKVIEENLTDPELYEQVRQHLKNAAFEVDEKVSWDNILEYILEHP